MLDRPHQGQVNCALGVLQADNIAEADVRAHYWHEIGQAILCLTDRLAALPRFTRALSLLLELQRSSRNAYGRLQSFVSLSTGRLESREIVVLSALQKVPCSAVTIPRAQCGLCTLHAYQRIA